MSKRGYAARRRTPAEKLQDQARAAHQLSLDVAGGDIWLAERLRKLPLFRVAMLGKCGS